MMLCFELQAQVTAPVQLAPKTFKCLFANARSLVKKMCELEALVSDYDPDIVGIVETWGRDNVAEQVFTIPGYTIYRRDRSDTMGGGIAVYCRDCYQTITRPDLSDSGYEESLWIEFVFPKSRLLVGTVYRPHYIEENDDKFEVLLKRAYSEGKPMCVMGDFNYSKIDWITLDADTRGTKFMDLIQDCFMVQHVDRPTREDRILDLVITTEPPLVEKLQVREHLGKSDHSVVTWELVMEVDIPSNHMEVFNLNKGNYTQLKSDLDVDWESEFSGNTSGCWDVFTDKLRLAMEKNIPTRKCRTRTKPLWVTRQVKQACRRKYKMWKRYKLSRSLNDYELYKQSQNRATCVVKDAKREFEFKVASNIKNNFFGVFRSMYVGGLLRRNA
jgi:hypothetical protein